MTTLAAPVMEKTSTPRHARTPGFLYLFISGILVFLYPPLSRSWTRAGLLRAIPIALFNTLCAFLWSFLVLVIAYIWAAPELFTRNAGKLAYPSLTAYETYRHAALVLREEFLDQWRHANVFDRSSPFVALILLVAAAYLLPYFVILPFGVRPGSNKAATRHVARTVLLGSSLIHWWGASYAGALLLYAAVHVSPNLELDYSSAVSPLLTIFTVLTFWTLVVLVVAVRHEYRTDADLPQPHDPWCDDCGYILTGIDPAGRCPECGRLIADSLGPGTRLPTPWEDNPRFRHLRIVGAQIAAVVHHPRRLFFTMPTLTGQRAAQRWHLGSILVLFVLALPIVPALYLAFHAEWNFALIAGSLAMALVWAVFGLMMVGIETAGIATFSRLRGQVVHLATSAKVTAYSAILMVPWILLGGAQLVVFTYLASQRPNGIQKLFNVGDRGEQVILALSLAAAHIGGLLWYELTVYRGVRAIQYANK
jgi:hypothetical protein